MGASNKKSEQIYRWVIRYIDENKFSGNLKLPSENTLCRTLAVSRETVRTALERLMQEGYVYKVKGSGTYINKEAVLPRTLNAGKAPCKIGLILQGQDKNVNSDLIKGVKSTLPGGQVELCVFVTDNKFANERRCLQTVVNQNFQGFIIDGVKSSLLHPNLDCYHQISRRRIPIIFYNYYKNTRYPRVTVNDLKCANRLVELLLQAGHRNIAGIFSYDDYQSVEKFHGMAAAMQRRGVELQDDYIKWCSSGEIFGQGESRCVEKFLKGLPRCTAVVCCNNAIYRTVRKALKKMGKRVPEDYSLVCFDYSDGDWEQEGITCSIYQSYQMGQCAASRLMKMIQQRECEDREYSYVLEPEIYVGRSVRQL